MEEFTKKTVNFIVRPDGNIAFARHGNVKKIRFMEKKKKTGKT